MLKTIWAKIKAPFQWMGRLWDKFNDWVATWAPGLKTKIVAGFGALGSFAVAAQDYFNAMPMDKFVSGTTYAVGAGVLFTLAFWFRGMAKR